MSHLLCSQLTKRGAHQHWPEEGKTLARWDYRDKWDNPYKIQSSQLLAAFLAKTVNSRHAKLHGKLPFVKAKLRLEPSMSPSSSLRKSSCTGEALLSTPPLEAAVSSRLPEGEASPRKRKLSEGCSESSVVQSWR